MEKESHPLLIEPGSPQKKSDFKALSLLMFYMHGIGLLLPYNAIFAAMDYFKELYPKS